MALNLELHTTPKPPWQGDLAAGYDSEMIRYTVAALQCLALVLCGCPSEGFFGRYKVVNKSASTVSNIALTANGVRQDLADIPPGDNTGFFAGQFPGGPKVVTVSWKDDSGDHEETISFKKYVAYRSSTEDLCIDLTGGGGLKWRIVKD